MAIYNVPRRAKPNVADRLAKALADLPPGLIDKEEALGVVSRTPAFERWLFSRVKEIETNLGHVLTTPLPWNIVDRVQSDSGVPRKWLEFYFFTRPLWQNVATFPNEFRAGMLSIGAVSKFEAMQIAYVYYNTVALRFSCTVSIDARISSHMTVENQGMGDSVFVGSYHSGHWSAWLNIPLGVLACWIRGETEDPAKAVALRISDNVGLRYRDTPTYPLQLFRLFRDLGDNAFEQLVRIRCLEPETGEAIARRINEIGFRSNNNTSERQSELTKEQAGSLSKIAPPSSPDRILALQLRKDDLERLDRIRENDGIVLSTAPWMRLLRYESRSGPSTFFDRMQAIGLITTTKGPDGVGISATLSEKGKRVLDAF